MSSTGINNGNFNNLESDIIDVNDSLFINKTNIIDIIYNSIIDNSVNDGSGNNVSGYITNKINDISDNINNRITYVDGYLNNKINDVSGNINNTIIDLSANLSDLSENVQVMKRDNTFQDIKLIGYGAQIQGNTDAIVALGGILTTNVAATGAHTVLIDGIILSLGIPSTVLTPGTGIYGSIDSKTNRSLFGSGNVAIYGIGPLEYINLVYNNDHFEDIKLISNHALNLKEPYKSLPNALNNLSNIVNTKQDNLLFTSPLLKDASNNITIDLSSYVLKTKFDLSFNDLQNKSQNNLLFTSPLLKDVSNNITIDLSAYPLKINVDSSLNNIINTKQNIFTCISPLIKNDVSNNITIDLSAYVLKTNFDSSLNNIINTKQNNLLFTSPLLKDVSNNITIDLSSYVLKTNFDSSLNNIINTKQNIFTCISPLIKNDVSNNITIDLSAYPLKTNVDSSLNNLKTTKQDNLLFTSPLLKDLSNNVTIDLSAYPLKTNVDSSLNNIINTKQNIFTCISPLIKNDVSNNVTIDLSAYPLKTNVDSSLNDLKTTKQDNINVTSPLIKTTNNISIDLSAYALKNALNASNVTDGTLSVSHGGTGVTSLTGGKLLIGNGTDSILQSNNLSYDLSSNTLTSGTFSALNTITAYGGLFSSNNLSVGDTAFVQNDLYVYRNAYISTDINIGGKLTVFQSLFGANSTSKSLVKFQTKLDVPNNVYYYNLEIAKYYKTGQSINGNEYKIFNLTSWSEDSFSIINKCTVYISTQSPGIKYIMFYDNWGSYLPNGNQTGWQRDNSITYMTFMTTTQKNIITILENLL